MSAGHNSTKVIIIALFANLGIAIAKFTGAFFTQSASLLAEAVHSLVDCSNQVLLLIGSKKSKRAPTERHPLGYGREAFFWSFIVAILLFSLGGLFAIYEGIHKLAEQGEHSGGVSFPVIGLSILLVSIGLETYSFKACLDEVRVQNRYGSLCQWFKKTTASELLVIFTEDLAALLGLIIAALCLFASWLFQSPSWDAMGSMFVGILLVIVAVLLAIEIKSLIIGEAPDTDYRTFIEAELQTQLPSSKILRLIALQLGASEVLISCKFMPGTQSGVDRLIDAINAVERNVKAQFTEIRWLFFEPDHTD